MKLFAVRFPYKHSKFGPDMSIYPECNAKRHLYFRFVLPLITRDTFASVPAPFRFAVKTVIRYFDVISLSSVKKTKTKNKTKQNKNLS